MKRAFLILLLFSSLFSVYAQPSDCAIGRSEAEIHTGNLRARLVNSGSMFSKSDSLFYKVYPNPNLGCFWTNHASQKVAKIYFANSLWFSGTDAASGEKMVVAQTFSPKSQNYWPGPLLSSPPHAPSAAVSLFWDRPFSVHRASLDSFLVVRDAHSGLIPASLIPLEIKHWPGKSNPFLIQLAQESGLSQWDSFHQDLAPFVDADGNGLYNPQMGDYPDLGKRSSMVCWVMNDAGNTKRFPDSLATVSPGFIEYQVLVYGFPRLDGQYFLDNALFMDWKVTNKGPKTFSSSYLSIWADPEVGNYNDDYAACHPLKNLGFVYTGDKMGVDSSYYFGGVTPALGIKVLDAPGSLADFDGHDNNRNGITDEPGERALFSGFYTHHIGLSPRNGDPLLPSDMYRNQRMQWKDGSPVTVGGSGLYPHGPEHPATRFMFPGPNDPFGFSLGGTALNPVPFPSNWSEDSAGNAPGDRRILLNAGPFDFYPNQTLDCKYVFIMGFRPKWDASIQHLYAVSDSLEAYYPSLILNTDPPRPMRPYLSLYPNPTRDLVWIETPVEGATVEIYTLSGLKIRSQLLPSRKEPVSIRGFRPGLYALRVQSRGGTDVLKLVVE